MSTKPAELFSTTEGSAIFSDLPDGDLSISVRALCPASDVPILYKWMRHQFAGTLLKGDISLRELEESYISMIESDFAQPFMCLVNNIPVCQVDIYKTLQDTISIYYDARPGDYGLQLMVAPPVHSLANQYNIALLIKACLEYFFSFPEVGRIVADAEITNEWTNTLFKKTGFRYHKKVSIPYKTANLYIATRDSL